ncbi:prealbumin-like fold domain-containing protein, partial [Enterococcus sp. LJL99]
MNKSIFRLLKKVSVIIAIIVLVLQVFMPLGMVFAEGIEVGSIEKNQPLEKKQSEEPEKQQIIEENENKQVEKTKAVNQTEQEKWIQISDENEKNESAIKKDSFDWSTKEALNDETLVSTNKMVLQSVNETDNSFYTDENSPIINGNTIEYKFKYKLDKVHGKTYTIDIDTTFVDLQELQNGVNYKIIRDGNKYIVQFNEEVNGSEQGILTIKATIKTIEESKEYELKWKLNGNEESKILFIKKEADQQNVITQKNTNKSANGWLDGIISIFDEETKKQTIKVNSTRIGTSRLNYSLTLETPVAAPLDITDQLDELLVYDPSSFEMYVETWDAAGWNRTKNIIPLDYLTIKDNTFTISGYNLPANSKVTINYKAKIANPTIFEEKLNATLANQELNGKAGSIQQILSNQAAINGEVKEGNIQQTIEVTGEKEMSYPSGILTKSVDHATTYVKKDENGKFIPIPLHYTITADLTKFNETGVKSLTDNFIVTDILPEGVLLDNKSIKVTGLSIKEGTVDTTDETIGHYELTETGFTINLGKQPKNYTITIDAMITDISKITKEWGSNQAFDYYGFTNRVEGNANDFKEQTSTKTTVIDRKGQDTVTDEQLFKKSHRTEPEYAVIGEPLKVFYTFEVPNYSTEKIDLSKSILTDELDTASFDLSQGYKVHAEGNYQNADEYVTSKLENGVLTVEFDKNMPENMKKSYWKLTLELTTFPIIEQSQSLIKNSATLEGTDTGITYSSTTQTSGETIGGELLVRKTVTGIDSTEYKKNYVLELDQNGVPKQKEFNYKIDLIPQEDFKSTKILPIEDLIPAELEFVGLLSVNEADNAIAPSNTVSDYTNNGGKVHVSYESGRLSIDNNNGSIFGSGTISIRFRVRLKDPESIKKGKIITNLIKGDTPAVITVRDPDSYPLTITKVDSKTNKLIDDEEGVARFKLTKENDVITSSIRISQGQLVNSDGTSIMVKEAGEYLLTETVPPKGYKLSTTPMKITVDENGSTGISRLLFKNDPLDKNEEPEEPKKVRVGDYVWFDENKDGLQDETDKPIAGVVLVLTDKTGKPVKDVYGNNVEPTITDAKGWYEFKDLPAGHTYTVKIDREKSSEALKGYEPTKEVAGDLEKDSSTWEATSRLLEEDGEHDLTLDFGFVKIPEKPEEPKKVRVGDYVWFDENKDGLQDETDKPIAGVVLVLTDETGKPVKDVYGNNVEPTITDAKGWYEFKDLPAGHTYTVKIDREKSSEALKGYEPTKEVAGDLEKDSSTWEATSRLLEEDGEHDLTLDFGFVKIP